MVVNAPIFVPGVAVMGEPGVWVPGAAWKPPGVVIGACTGGFATVFPADVIALVVFMPRMTDAEPEMVELGAGVGRFGEFCNPPAATFWGE